MEATISKYLLLGGEGFIGRELTVALRSAGHFVMSVDNLDAQVHKKNKPHLSEASQFFQRDLTEQDWWDSIDTEITQFDAVYFLVAQTGTSQSMWESNKYVLSNLSSLSILNDLYTAGQLASSRNDKPLKFGRLILTSSRAVYPSCSLNDLGQIRGSHEDDLPSPVSIYGATKLAQEAIVNAGFQGCSKVIFRLQNVYGPSQTSLNIYTGVVATFAARALAGLNLSLFSSDPVIRDFVFINDVVEALHLAGTQLRFPSATLNVGTGIGTTIEELAKLIIDLVGSSSRLELLSRPLHDPSLVQVGLANCDRAKLHGIECKTTLSDGLMQTLIGLSENSPRGEDLPSVEEYVEKIKITFLDSQMHKIPTESPKGAQP